MLVGGAITGGIEMISQLSQVSGNFRCLNWAEIGFAAGAGAVGGMLGFAGAALGVSIAGSGLMGALLAGGMGGLASGVGIRTVQTAVSGNWNNWQNDIFNPGQMAADLAFGAVGGGVGYGIRQISYSKPILNNRNEPYPKVNVPRYGKVPFPENAQFTPKKLRVPRSLSYREQYINIWETSGKPVPRGGWKNYQIHHIQPLEYGGTNDMSNLIHLSIPKHRLFTNWWAGGYAPK